MVEAQHLLIIGTVWPEPKSSAAGARMVQLMELFLSKKWKITFACTAANSEFMVDLADLGVEKAFIELNNSSFDLFISNLNPEMVLFDRFMIEEQFGWRVAEQCPDAIRILDTEDLHCLRAARKRAFKENRKFNTDDLMIDIAMREIASILRCDISLIISNVEMDLLKNHFKVQASLLFHLPFMLDAISEDDIAKLPAFESRKHFIFIGNFLHDPNVNAVLFLKEEIWPLIRKQLPEAELHICGAYPSQKIKEMHQPKEGFLIMGRVESARTIVQNAKVCIAPLRFGAGLKGKLVEAMLCGTPSVTTTIGAEGMHGEMDWNGMVANRPEDIAAAAVKLYTNSQIWSTSQQNGFRIINTYYPKISIGEGFMAHLLKEKRELKKNRLNNFIGAMLMHHTLSSTKYMSRWIEEKNKN